MIEPVSVGVIAAALFAKALDRAGDGVVDGGIEVVKKGVSALREWFSSNGDAEAEKALERLVEVPDSRRREEELAAVLVDRMEDSEELRVQLEALVSQAEEAGVVIGPITQTVEGDGNVQVAGTSNSEINIDPSAVRRTGE